MLRAKELVIFIVNNSRKSIIFYSLIKLEHRMETILSMNYVWINHVYIKNAKATLL